MHASEATRVANLPQYEKDRLGLEDSVHIVSGTLEGNGATALASEKAELRASVVKLARTTSGGIEYQVAIFVDEPAPAPAPEPEKAPPTAEETAAAYLVEKGKSAEEAKAAVEKFGVAAILKKRQADLDSQLDALVTAKAE